MRPLLLIFLLCQATVFAQSYFVPSGGNAWVSHNRKKETPGGLVYNSDAPVTSTYVWMKAGSLQVSIAAKVNNPMTINVGIQSEFKSVYLAPGQKEHAAGTWTIASEGYIEITMSLLTPNDFSGLQLSGTAVSESMAFVRNNEGNYFYWGRRGPSVHLRFDTKDKDNIEWFYSEIKVPAGSDVIGSYYMANGFSDGYFGYQVNSETERRVLFSVWSPYKTDDPKSIPEEDRIILVRKGEGVYTGEFGNEGSGGQSYLRYPWKAGSTYGFLLRAQPEGPNTIYTAWFNDLDEHKWKLIASWRRPKKATYITSLYSFLENFIPETGSIERSAQYGNQWVCDQTGKWSELTRARFTGDNTARKNYRKDYGGGARNEVFYLRNCGFFSDFTTLDQALERMPTGKSPNINFSSLP